MATRKVNGTAVDGVCFDPETQDEPLAVEIQRNMYVQRSGYRFWALVNYGLGATFWCTLVPSIMLNAGFGIIVGTLAGIMFAIIQPNEHYRNYAAAVQKNQAARTEYVAGNKEEAQRLLRCAIDLTTP